MSSYTELIDNASLAMDLEAQRPSSDTLHTARCLFGGFQRGGFVGGGGKSQ